MDSLQTKMTTVMQNAFAAAGLDPAYAKVNLSNRPDLCEYQCNGALAAAKQYRKNPMELAEAVAAELKEQPLFEKVEAVRPGFLNLTVAKDSLALTLSELAETPRFGTPQVGTGKTIVLDYGGANVAKPLHVGHLRPAIIGECLKRVCRYVGFHAIGDVHLGDWGLQMGLIIEELRLRQPDLPYFDPAFSGQYPEEAPFTIADLEEIYPTAAARAKEDADFAAKAHEATFRLQQGDPGYSALFKQIIRVSVEDLKKNYGALGVTFDLWKGESDAQPYIEPMIADMEAKGLLQESQGALVMDVSEPTDAKEVPPCLVRKSDGAYLYATTDLATLVEREKLYHPNEYFYTTDKRQEMHFLQVFRAARKAGIVPAETRMTHLGFGTMNGKDGKPFKTRQGGVMRLEYLIADVQEAVYKRMAGQEDKTEEEKQEIARKVALAALKYGDLSNQASKDYIFDLERFTSFDGNTGPYILYTIVRIHSILEKYAKKEGNSAMAEAGRVDPVTENATERHGVHLRIRPALSAPEKALQLLLARTGEVIRDSYEEKAPHKICQLIYELANTFSSFYHETHILSEEDSGKQLGWVSLLALTERVLRTCIDLLGFEAPERM